MCAVVTRIFIATQQLATFYDVIESEGILFMVASSSLKPSASCSTHLLAGALVWSVVGMALALRGLFNMVTLSSFSIWWPVIALAVGLIKGKFVFVKSAKKSVTRILERGDGRCLGGFLSIKNWLLVLLMMIFGRLLRVSDLPGEIVWGVYVAAGSALALSSHVFWSAWFLRRKVAAKTGSEHSVS